MTTSALRPADVERFRAVVAQRLGLHFDPDRFDYLSDILRRRMEAVRAPDCAAYLERLAGQAPPSTELRALAEQLTVSETFFFRNADNFRAVVEAVLPERVRARGAVRRLRILSAGCASGEEPYSLAASVREAVPDLSAWDVQIVAVDINPAVLERAAQARYSRWALRATPEELRKRHFREEGKDFVLDPAVQQMVTFEEHNLADDDAVLWQPGSYDLIFCRNVIMYFTAETARAVVGRIARALAPGGFLFLGHAETLRGLSQEFHLCHTHGTFYYCRRDGPAQAVSFAIDRSAAAPAFPETLPLVPGDASWVEVIGAASARIASLSQARKAGVRSPAEGPRPPARWDSGQVLEAMREERFAEALQLVTDLPKAFADSPDALLLRCALLTNAGRLEEAGAACERLLALDELNAGAHYLMALRCEHAGDDAAAIEHDQAAIYLDAAFAMPHLHLGLIAKRRGDAGGASRALAQARALLAREDAARLLLFGGGFPRESLIALCAEPGSAGA